MTYLKSLIVYLGHSSMASLIINILALGGIVFSLFHPLVLVFVLSFVLTLLFLWVYGQLNQVNDLFERWHMAFLACYFSTGSDL